MRVLGIDPGTAVMGYGVVEAGSSRHPVLVECGTLTAPARAPLPVRLRVLYEGVSELLSRHTPEALAVESAFYGRNVRTAVVLSHARGVILLAGELAGVNLAEYSPASVKKAIVGRGAALKPQVGYMVAGVGIGTEMAVNGATSHAFAHILYKALLFMGAGAVIYVTGRRKLTELGGLYKAMPLTVALYMIGAFAISASPAA